MAWLLHLFDCSSEQKPMTLKNQTSFRRARDTDLFERNSFDLKHLDQVEV